MLFYICPQLETLLPAAANTIRKWVTDEFQKHKKDLINELAASLSIIHLSFDLWTSPNGVPIIAVVAHFISGDGKKKRRMLGL